MEETLNKLGITEEQLEIVKKWCDDEDRRAFEEPFFDPIVFFDDGDGTDIHNIFYEGTGRFELDIKEAVEEYGEDNIREFCQKVLARA